MTNTIVDFRPEYCCCGCGGNTSGRFKPGHDRKLRVALKRCHRAACSVTVRLGSTLLHVSALEAASYLTTSRSDWPADVIAGTR